MRLRTINHLRRFGFVLIVQAFDEPDATERGHTGLVPHLPELNDAQR